MTEEERKTLRRTWAAMHTRCYNKNVKEFTRYGGRGIYVSRKWHRDNPDGFDNFCRDMGPRPQSLSIDRINNNGPYRPSNCRWATSDQQCRHKRVGSKKRITWNFACSMNYYQIQFYKRQAKKRGLNLSQLIRQLLEREFGK